MRGKNREGLKFSKYTSMTTSTADCISPASVIRDGTVYSQSYVGGLGSKFHQQQQLSTSLSSLLASTNSGANSGASPQQNSSGNVVQNCPGSNFSGEGKFASGLTTLVFPHTI